MANAACRLPDDVLLLVFEYLDTASLLSARGVCRRWRDVALSRAAWRHRDFASFEPRLGAVLRMAPCLRRLELNLASLLAVPRHDVSCAVSTVSIECGITLVMFGMKSFSWSSINSWKAHDTLRVLHALLRAGALHLALRNFDSDQASLRLLLRAIRGSKLRGLSLSFLRNDHTGGGTFSLRGVNEASLQRIEFSNDKYVPSWSGRQHWPSSVLALEFLLRTHASTLTSVSLVGVPRQFPVALLAACVNLRELKCPALENMAVLLQCSALESLHLVVTLPTHTDHPAVLRGVRDFFRGAAGLRRLTLSISEMPILHRVHVYMDFLRILAGTRSQLTSLTAWSCSFVEMNYVDLSALLPAFTKLTRVVLGPVGPTRECWPHLVDFLDAITPATTPLLRLLELDGAGVCPDTVGPSGRHVVQAIRALMGRNPVLHFAGLVVCIECEKDMCYRRLQCDHCWSEGGVAKPTPFLLWSSLTRFGFFSHNSKEACDLHKGHARWVRLEAALQ